MASNHEIPAKAVRTELVRAHELGFLGPRAVSIQIDHAEAFSAAVLGSFATPPLTLADLGSGGGVPVLVLIRHLPDTRIWCVERSATRARFLRSAARRLDVEDRLFVLESDAFGVSPADLGLPGVELATARSFGPPAELLAAAARILVPGGHLAVSDPPGGGARWAELTAGTNWSVVHSNGGPPALTILQLT